MTKRFFALLMAVVMVLALSVPAFAEANADLNTQVELPENPASLEGHSFVAYRIFTGTQSVDASETDIAKLADIDWDTNQFNGSGFLAALKANETIGSYFAKAETAAEVAVILSDYQDESKFAREFAKVAEGFCIGNGTAVENGSTALDPGYYLIKDTSTGKDAVNLALLQLTQKDTIEIKSKVEVPSIIKNIDGNKDTDETNSGLVDSNNGAIGDDVPYVISANVPDMQAYEHYFFVVNDTMSKGLTFNNDVAITVGTATLVKDTDFTVTSSPNSDDSTSIQIAFINFIKYKENAGANISITYSGKINTDALIGVEGNPNTAKLVYSNNPNVTPEWKTKTIPDSDDVVGETPEDKVITYVTQLQILKVDGAKTSTPLANAEFELAGTKLNTTIVTTQEFSTSESGTYYKLKDNTYTNVAPTNLTVTQYASTTEKYELEETTKTVTKEEAVNKTGVTGEDGLLVFTGLASGTYTLTETKAPKGYNKLKDPVKVVITWTAPASSSTSDCTWAANDGATPNATSYTVDEDGTIKVTVTNNSGTVLPETGGIGTTIFYVVGAVLVAGAAIVLFARKRAEE